MQQLGDDSEPFGRILHSNEKRWLAWNSEEGRRSGEPVERRWQKENGVRRAGAMCIRDHAWEIGEIAVAAVNGSAPEPCRWLELAVREGCWLIYELSTIV